jgi:NitT/TauT family transport system ATP-binding protein
LGEINPLSPFYKVNKIQFIDVTFSYGQKKGKFTAVKKVNLAVKPGEFVSVIGPSGCGKSTLLSLVAGLNFPSEGCVLLDGKSIAGTGNDRGIVFQHYSLFPWMTAEKNIVFGIEQVSPGRTKKENEQLALKYLQLVGLKGFGSKYPAQLSGGMQQRVAIARAFAMNPQILLLDEPFGALDAKNKRALQEVLLKLWNNGDKKVTVFMVTHDIDEAIMLSDRIIVLAGQPGTVKHEIMVPFPRPRLRSELIRTGEYTRQRNTLVNFFFDELLEEIGGEEVIL